MSYLIFSFIIIFLDRFTKLWALQTCIEKITIHSFLSCHLTFNRGISWSLLYAESSLYFALVTLFVITVIVCISWYTYQQYKEQKLIWAEVAVIAAALSNVVDRIWYGGVIDFILLEYHSFRWPLFNIADCVIVLGLLYMVFDNLRFRNATTLRATKSRKFL